MATVIVTVTGIQRDDTGEESRIELVTVGRHYEKNGIHYITYDETEVSGMEGTTTLLKLYGDSVAVVRMGKVEHKQEFRLGEKTYSTYVTPYGSLKMALYTSKLDHSYQAIGGNVHICYELEIDGQWQSSNELSVNIREERRNGH
jgi:uncharacterized beta-barrel protein YwiB (DUF1934 family)